MWRIKLILVGVCALALVQQGLTQSGCPSPNGYFGDPSQCDAYTECVDGVAERKLCPDGLMFNDQNTNYPRYPCSYPQEVECGSRTRTRYKRLPRIGR